MKLTLEIELSPEREKWATTVWQTAVAAKETEAQTLDEYLEGLVQPFVDQRIAEITDSWKPAETAEDTARREAVAAALQEIPLEKLAAIEAAIEAAKE